MAQELRELDGDAFGVIHVVVRFIVVDHQTKRNAAPRTSRLGIPFTSNLEFEGLKIHHAKAVPMDYSVKWWDGVPRGDCQPLRLFRPYRSKS